MTFQEICWGMIGAGSVTEKKSAPGLYKSKHSSLSAVYSRTEETARSFAQRHGVPIVYSTVEELLNDTDINAVYIATPPKFHKDYAIKCMKAGKIPYIEKPMANSLEECEEIMATSIETGIPVYVAYYRRAMDRYIKIKELLDSGSLGKIRCVRMCQMMKPEPEDMDRDKLPWRLIPSQTGGGKFVDMVSHVLDISVFFFGQIAEICSQVDNFGGLYEVEDTLSASFRYKNGVIGSGLWCYVSDHDEEELLIVGEKGNIRTNGLFNGPVHVTIEGHEQVLNFPDPEHVAQPYIQSIVNELTGNGKSNANILDAIHVAELVDDILEEYRKRY